uniref:Uncharacterized protein n=1 Tax=viral metagenome TaxID=1070528 RepID=A0A6M3KIK6_9ZZZZ
MLTLYVIPSGRKNSDINQTVESFSGLKMEFKSVHNIAEIMVLRKEVISEDDWFCVLFDNEKISEGLRTYLPVYFGYPSDVLVAIKKDKEDKTTQSPRFFKNHVELPDESLLPSKEGNYRFLRIMDGWVLENDLH